MREYDIKYMNYIFDYSQVKSTLNDYLENNFK